MKKNDILTKLIEYYENCIKEMPLEDWRNYLTEKCIRTGICHTANRVFNADMYGRTWVSDHITFDDCYWFKPTYHAETREEAIELLQLRVDKMKKIISQ